MSYQNIGCEAICCCNNSLLENLYHDDWNIRKQTALLIKEMIIEEALIPLLYSTFEGSNYLIPKIISKIGKNNIQLLSDIAKNNNEKLRVRQHAIEGLGRLGFKSVLKCLYKLLKDSNIYIRISTILAIGNIREKSSIPVLLDLLKSEDKMEYTTLL